MKIAWIAVMLLVGSVAFAQQQPQPQVNDNRYTVSVDTTKLNAAQQVEQIAQVLEKHGSGPMERIYKAAFHRQVANVVLLFLGSLIAIVVSVGLNFAKDFPKDSPINRLSMSRLMMIAALGLLIGGVYRGISLDYYAIQDIAFNIASFAR